MTTRAERFTKEDVILLDGLVGIWEQFTANFPFPDCDQAHAGTTALCIRLRAKIAARVEAAA